VETVPTNQMQSVYLKERFEDGNVKVDQVMLLQQNELLNVLRTPWYRI